MPYILLVFFTLGPVIMTWKAIQLWKNANLVDDFMDAFSFLPFGKEVRRGEVRSFGLSVTSVWGVAVLIWLALTDSDSSAPSFVLIAALVTILVPLLCEVSVVLFNTPKFVVPPHMRSDAGVLAARRARRAAGSKRLEP